MNKVRKNKLITKVKSMTNLCAMDRSYVQYEFTFCQKKKKKVLRNFETPHIN